MIDQDLRDALADSVEAPVRPFDMAALRVRAAHRRRRRHVATGVAAVLVVGFVAAMVGVVRLGGGSTRIRTGRQPVTSTPVPLTAPTSSPAPTMSPDPTATTLPAQGTYRNEAVQVWTGSEYLVWGGQAGGDGHGRADGWRYEPKTGAIRDIPVAPIAPREVATGVWTGTKLIVCCGRPVAATSRSDPAGASGAAFDPASGRWSLIASPPPEVASSPLGSVWTGKEMFVLTGNTLTAYDPARDRWRQRATPPGGLVFRELVLWTGRKLVVWSTSSAASPGGDSGSLYDPVDDSWTELPPLPADHPTRYASSVWIGGELIVWGNDQQVDVRAVGYRWRPGDTAWRPMSPAPIAPVRWGEWTPGSQTLVVDERTGRVIVVSLATGAFSDPTAAEGRRPLLAYDPADDTWEGLGSAPALGYGRVALFAGGQIFAPDQANPAPISVPPATKK